MCPSLTSISFLPHIFFEVNPRYVILLVKILVCTAKKSGLFKKKPKQCITILLLHQNINYLISSYIQMVCWTQDAHKVYPLQLVDISFKSVLLI